jgi:hypothetical protein
MVGILDDEQRPRHRGEKIIREHRGEVPGVSLEECHRRMAQLTDFGNVD